MVRWRRSSCGSKSFMLTSSCSSGIIGSSLNHGLNWGFCVSGQTFEFRAFEMSTKSQKIDNCVVLIPPGSPPDSSPCDSAS
jgi:hypothetical protein